MRTYRLPPSGFPAFRRTLIRSGLIVSGLAVSVALWAVWHQTGGDNLTVVLLSVPLLAVAMGIGIRKAIHQQKEIWSSVEIRMDDGAIGRSQLRIPEVLLRREEVTAVIESSQGLTVKSADRFRSLLIPRLLDPRDYAEIREDLATWVPIETAKSGEKWKAWAFLILLAGGFLVMFFSRNRLLVATVALGLLAVYTWSAWRAYHQEGVDPKTRKTHLLFLVLILLFAAGRLAVLFGVW